MFFSFCINLQPTELSLLSNFAKVFPSRLETCFCLSEPCSIQPDTCYCRKGWRPGRLRHQITLSFQNLEARFTIQSYTRIHAWAQTHDKHKLPKETQTATVHAYSQAMD